MVTARASELDGFYWTGLFRPPDIITTGWEEQRLFGWAAPSFEDKSITIMPCPPDWLLVINPITISRRFTTKQVPGLIRSLSQ